MKNFMRLSFRENEIVPFKTIILVVMMFARLPVSAQVEWAMINTKTSDPFNDGLACFTVHTKQGYIDANGKVAIEPIFDRNVNSDFDHGTAIVRIEDKSYGIIDIHGQYVLEPVYKSISRCKEAEGMYEIMDSTDKRGLFYNNKIVIPCKYKYLYCWYYPFIGMAEDEDKTQYINIDDGRIYESIYKNGIQTLARMGDKEYVYVKNELIDKSKYTSSSKGTEIFYDEKTKSYGLKNKSGNIITPAKYGKPNEVPFWLNDMIVFKCDTTKESDCVLVNSEGNEVLKAKRIRICDDNYIITMGDKWDLYTSNGKKILQESYDLITQYEDAPDWFKLSNKINEDWEYYVYRVSTGKIYDKADSYEMTKDGIIVTTKKQGDNYLHGFINTKTGKEIEPKYYGDLVFSEGLAVVQRSYSAPKMIIDKNDRVILSESDCKLSFYKGFSEGVLGVRDKVGKTWGYIYNPLGHEGYTYNNSNTDASNLTIYRWLSEGINLMNSKQYTEAKDYFYRAMMAAPKNADALMCYSLCIFELGYEEEGIEGMNMALDLEPNNETNKKNYNIALERKKARDQALSEEERIEEESTKSNTFWDALGNFCNALGNALGTLNQSNTYHYDNSSSSYPTNTGGNYQSQYQNWERLAQNHYNSLTNLGYRTKDNSGNRSGGTMRSMNSGNYIQMKKSLREAQQQMSRIRREAARNGVTIQQSKWETATVGY